MDEIKFDDMKNLNHKQIIFENSIINFISLNEKLVE